MSKREKLFVEVFCVGAAAVVAVTIWVVASAMEARAYNRLTGGHATTWDAMWAELRVMGSEKP